VNFPIQNVQCWTREYVYDQYRGFSADEKSAVWVLLCKQVVDMAEPCPAVKYTGVMDRRSLARYFRVRNLPTIVSITCCVISVVTV